MFNGLHFIPTGLDVFIYAIMIGGVIAIITSIVGMSVQFVYNQIVIYVYIGCSAIVALLLLTSFVIAFIPMVAPESTAKRFWNGLDKEKKGFVESSFRCCGWETPVTTNCTYYPIAGEVLSPCYLKMFMSYRAFFILAVVLSFLAFVQCATFIGLAVYLTLQNKGVFKKFKTDDDDYEDKALLSGNNDDETENDE